MAQVLNSWKEIANYLGRGVRTAQRWERDLRLPVRRPRKKSRSSVIAFTDELDRWLKRSPHNPHSVNQRLASMTASGKQLQENAEALAQNIRLLQENILRMVKLTRNGSSSEKSKSRSATAA